MPHRPHSSLFLIPGFPSDESDTGCLTAVQNYVAAYAARHPGRTVIVIAFQYPYERRRYRWHEVTVHALGGRNRRGVRGLITWTRALMEAVRLARRMRIAVIHSFWLGECAYVGQWLSRLLRIPHVASIGGQDARADNRYLRRLRLDRMTITAGSAFAADMLEKDAGRTVDAVVPIGLDDTFLQCASDDVKRNIDVLGVGSLIPLKRYDAFVDIVSELVSQRADLRAVIVGAGPEETSLRKRIEAAGLQRNVRLVGSKSREDVLQYMRRSRVLLHPSEYESQGYVFLEALACGLFVVCRNVGFVGGHPAAYRCASDDEMVAHVRAALAGGRPPRGHVPSVAETVEAFAALYERLS